MNGNIGRCKFVDGTTRDVHRDADGPQYVIDDDGRDVYGVWILDDDALMGDTIGSRMFVDGKIRQSSLGRE